MLQSLTLHNFALIESLQINFDKGFNVITGETGAGKSLLLDALDLCLGGRTDTALVRHGTAFADIYAEFATDNLLVQHWFENADRAFELPILIRRKITAQGRSSAWINGVPASLNELKSLGVLLVNIHSQHASLQLLKPNFIIDWLDDVGNLTDLSNQVKNAFKTYQTLFDKKQQTLREMDARTDKIDLLTARLLDIEPLLGVDIASCESRFDELSNMESLIVDAHAIYDILDGDSDITVLTQLNRCQKLCQNNQNFSQIFADSLENIATSYELLKDCAKDMRYYADNQSMDEDEYRHLSDIINLANRLSNKYRMNISQVLESTDSWQQELDYLNGLPDIDSLDDTIKTAFDNYTNLAKQLHDKRTQAAPVLCQRLSKHLHALALPHAFFEFAFTPKDKNAVNATGLYDIELLFSANVGIPTQPLHKVVSGGELSRISLIMQVMRAGMNQNTPLLIFDEVDIGISGGTAQVVGQLLRTLGEHCQLMVITHQAQVAVSSHQHILVKKQHGDFTQSQFDIICGDDKIHELARMSGGVDITDETLAHAKSLLSSVK